MKNLDWKNLGIKMAPFIIGVVIGVGVSNGWKYLGYIIGIYFLATVVWEIIMMFMKDRATQVTDLPEEKNTIADSIIINTGIGIKKGEDYFDKAIKIAIPIVLIGTLIATIVLFAKGQSVAGSVTGILFFNLIILKELWRKKRENTYVSMQ